LEWAPVVDAAYRNFFFYIRFNYPQKEPYFLTLDENHMLRVHFIDTKEIITCFQDKFFCGKIIIVFY